MTTAVRGGMGYARANRLMGYACACLGAAFLWGFAAFFFGTIPFLLVPLLIWLSYGLLRAGLRRLALLSLLLDALLSALLAWAFGVATVASRYGHVWPFGVALLSAIAALLLLLALVEVLRGPGSAS